MKIKIGDYLLIIFFLIISFFFIYKKNSNKSLKLEIITPTKKMLLNISNKKRILKIKGEKGYLLLEIKNKRVRVISSTCPNKICVKTGWISKKGDTIICVPNRIIIKIIENNKKNNSKIDFITR